MSPLARLALTMIRAAPRAFGRGAALAIVVLLMGAALLGLSGWFVTASAAAGLAGVGIGFDFFRPSAGVRFLAMGRAGARYGERMLTHDATLRALAQLRGRIHAGITRLPWEAQQRLRAARALNRLTSDVDALDGLMLRLLLPALSAALVLLAGLVLLWWLVAPEVALAVVALHAAGGALALRLAARRADRAATEEENALQGLRAGTLDLSRNRADLAVAGALGRAGAALAGEVAGITQARATLDALDRQGAAILSLSTAAATAAALWLGGRLAQAGRIDAATMAIGVFVALALGEGILLLRRGIAERGRMRGAAERVMALCDTPARAAPGPRAAAQGPLLRAEGLCYTRPGAARAVFGQLDLTLHPDETVLISGPSGAGKSTLLSVLAGLVPPTAGGLRLSGTEISAWPEAELRAHITMVPQRSALLCGTVAENLALAGTDDPARMWQALEAVSLAPALQAREGLETRLGPGGSGLSGGQARRLCLARAALRAPRILLLDEPSEGLDAETAAAALSGLRQLLPEAAIVIVSHREADQALAHRHIRLQAAAS